MIKKIKAILFELMIVFVSLFFGIFVVFFSFSSYLMIEVISKNWCRMILFFAKFVFFIDYRIENKRFLEFVNKNSENYNFIILSKHQSVLETLILFTLFKKPCYVLKKELFKIPIYGFCVKKSGMIGVNRRINIKHMNEMVNSIKDRFKKSFQIIIFSQGTRNKVKFNGENYYEDNLKYKWLFTKSLEDEKKKTYIVPVAINCGKLWPKGLLSEKKKGTATLKFGIPLKFNGLLSDRYKEIIENWTENETFRLINNLWITLNTY